MTDADLLTAAADKLDAMLAGATDGPWWFDESDQHWRLHGVHARLPGVLDGLPDQIVNSQILKAPKSSNVFEPYWPTAADGQLITTMANPLVSRALSTAFRACAAAGSPPRSLIEVARAVLGEDQP